MKTITAAKLMVPLNEYATVPKDANLFEAILALEKAQSVFDIKKHKHRAILVLNENKQVVGKLTMVDILKALEPKYGELDAKGTLSRSGHSPDLIKDMLKDNYLWSGTLEFICSRASDLMVMDLMEVPKEEVYIDADATLDEAIHQLVIYRHASLIVQSDKKVVGILRLSDVFSKICEEIKTCEF